MCELCGEKFEVNDIVNKTICCDKSCHNKCIGLRNEYLHGCPICKKKDEFKIRVRIEFDNYFSMLSKKDWIKLVKKKWCNHFKQNNFGQHVITRISRTGEMALCVNIIREEFKDLCYKVNTKLFENNERTQLENKKFDTQTLKQICKNMLDVKLEDI